MHALDLLNGIIFPQFCNSVYSLLDNIRHNEYIVKAITSVPRLKCYTEASSFYVHVNTCIPHMINICHVIYISIDSKS